MDWLDIGTYPIKKYNTEGLLDMEFPTLFPNGDYDWLHPRFCNVKIHEYPLHIFRYHD